MLILTTLILILFLLIILYKLIYVNYDINFLSLILLFPAFHLLSYVSFIILYYIGFVNNPLFQYRSNLLYTDNDVINLNLVLIFFFIFYVTSIFITKKLYEETSNTVIKEINFFTIFVIDFSLILLLVLNSYFCSTNNFLLILFLLSCNIHYLYYLNNKKRHVVRYIFYLKIFIFILIVLSFSITHQIFLLLICLISINYFFYKKLSIKQLILIIIIILLIIPAREVVRFNNNNNIFNISICKNSIKNTNTNLLNFIEVTKTEYSNINNFYRFLTRPSHTIETLIMSIKLTPNEIPYWSGYTYRPLLTFFIPRFIYNNKPREEFGNEFGRRYHVISEKETSWNLPWITEAYINFGLYGIFFLGLLLPMLFILIDFYLKKLLNNPDLFITGLTTYLLLSLPESNISLMLSTSIKLFIILSAIIIVIHYIYKFKK